jgi:hypothetical protein
MLTHDAFWLVSQPVQMLLAFVPLTEHISNKH